MIGSLGCIVHQEVMSLQQLAILVYQELSRIILQTEFTHMVS